MAEYILAGDIGKRKFPAEHAAWVKDMAAQGFARNEAMLAAKAEKKAEVERKTLEKREAKAGQKSSVMMDNMSSGFGDECVADDGEFCVLRFFRGKWGGNGRADGSRDRGTEREEEERVRILEKE